MLNTLRTQIKLKIRACSPTYVSNNIKNLPVINVNSFTKAAAAFPIRGDANPRGEGAPTYDFAKFSEKLHKLEKILGRRGAPGEPPLDPPLLYICYSISLICFRGITSNQWKESYSEGKIDDDETLIRVRYGRTNDCRPCTSPPDFVGKTIDELLSSDFAVRCE